MEKNFVAILQQKTGLRAETDRLFFSPFGLVQGKGLNLSGEWEKQDIEVQISNYKISPRKNLLIELWNKQSEFDFKTLEYDIWLKDVKVRNQSKGFEIIISEMQFGWDDGIGEMVVDKVHFSLPDEEISVGNFSLNLKKNLLSALIKDLHVDGKNSIKMDLLQLDGRWPGQLAYFKEGDFLNQLLFCLEDLRLVGISGKLNGHDLGASGGRLVRTGDQRWDLSLQSKWDATNVAMISQLEKGTDGNWSLKGLHQPNGWERSLNYELYGKFNEKGPWRLVLFDGLQNRIEADVTRDGAKEWVGTWNADMVQIPMLNDQWPAISGRFDGGFFWDGQDARLVLKGNNIQGGPGKTRSGTMDLLASYNLVSKSIRLHKLLIGEEALWSGNLNGEVSINPLKLETLNLHVKNFPLGQYSPKVDGFLDIDGLLLDDKLNVNVNSAGLFPDKNPLEKIESLNVSVQVDDQNVHYRQSFQQHGDINVIQVHALVDHLLTDPMKIKGGTLTELHSSSTLFELRLRDQVPVRINLEGVEVQDFFIDDLNRRLRRLKGHAYIPFIMPSRLLIEAKGSLDLGEMPAVGENKVSGMVNIYRARWDKGWALSNLDVSWKADQIKLVPSSILSSMSVVAKGTLQNRLIQFDELTGRGQDGSLIHGSGNYHFGQRQFWLDLVGEKLTYNSKDYQFNYSSPYFHIEGEPLALQMVGQIKIDQFLYSGDFTMMNGGSSPYRHRLETKPPESQEQRHQIDLTILSDDELQVNNNAAQLKFGIDQLNIHGPLSNLRWKGSVRADTRKSNRVILPFQWLDVSFQAKNLQLVFDDEDHWNPNIHLQAETQVDGVQVFLWYDDAMNNLGEGKFKLGSSPSYSRKEILSLLGSGEEPSQEVFAKTTGDESAQEAGPSFTLIKSRGKKKEQQQFLNYSAGVSAGEAPFEFRVDYRLGQHLGIEVTQTATNGTFFGLRYAKQISQLSDLVRRVDLVDQKKEEIGADVIWEFSGLKFGENPRLKSKLIELLSNVEGLLQRSEYIIARQQITSILSDTLADEGYLSATCEVKVIRKENVMFERRGTYRGEGLERIVIQVHLELGEQLSVTDVHLENWPTYLAYPDHPWFSEGRFRTHLLKKSELNRFKELLLTKLADRGYPAAEIVELSLEPVVLDDPIEVSRVNSELVSENPPSVLWRNTHPHRLSVELNPGRIHRLVQLYIEGAQSMDDALAKRIVGYQSNMVYNESMINQYPEKLKKWYENNGFFGTRIQVVQILKSRRYPRISIHLKIDEGKRWSMGKIDFEGIEKSDESYLRQVAGLVSYSPANPDALSQALSQLSRLPQLMSVEYHWSELNEGSKDLVIQVKENPAWRFATRLGFQSDDGLQWALRLSYGNLFGKGETLGFENNISQKEQHYLLRYEVPDIFRRDWGLQWIGGYQKDLITNNDLENQTFVTGISLSHEKHQRSWGYDIIYREDRNIEGEFPSLRLKSVIRSSAVPLPKQPGRGWGWNLKNQLIAYLDRSQFAYLGEYRLSFGFKLGGSMLTPWAKVGNKWDIGSSFELPLADRFFLGGTGSLRGYKEGSLDGPRDRGGESTLSYGAELFYPLMDWIDGSLFYEWGRVSDQSFWKHSDPGVSSIGMGILFRTPVGPIEGYFAHPIGLDNLGVLGLQLGTIF